MIHVLIKSKLTTGQDKITSPTQSQFQLSESFLRQQGQQADPERVHQESPLLKVNQYICNNQFLHRAKVSRKGYRMPHLEQDIIQKEDQNFLI